MPSPAQIVRRYHMNTLQLLPKVRGGISGKSKVLHYDFLIDGSSLLSILGQEDADPVSPFDKVYIPSYAQKTERVFLLLESADLKSDPVLFYVCPECGGIGCGAITGRIEEQGGVIVWSDFAFETVTGIEESFNSLGPFRFEKTVYMVTIAALKNGSAA
jgi:hypothetical protein